MVCDTHEEFNYFKAMETHNPDGTHKKAKNRSQKDKSNQSFFTKIPSTFFEFLE
jgi:hypothetical protein